MHVYMSASLEPFTYLPPFNQLFDKYGLWFRLIFEYGPKEYQNDIRNIDIAKLSS